MMKWKMAVKVDRYVLHRMNRRNVLECIVWNSPINQAAIAEKVNLSIPSVMKIVSDLLSEGLVRSAGKGKSSGGKPPELLTFVRDAYYMVGLDIGRSALKIIISDMTGEVIYQHSEETGQSLPPENLIKRIGQMTINTIAASNVPKEKLLGIGVGMPGLIDASTGHVIFSPDFHWKNVSLREELQKMLPYRVMVENSNLSLARGEHSYGSGIGADFIVCISVGHGIGAGIIFDGKPYYGRSGTSGEIGHVTMEPNGPVCLCGNHGCLEALASGAAVARSAYNILQQGVPTLMRDLVEGHIERVDAKIVFQAAKAGDEVALDIVNRITNYIGIAIAGYINLMDPERVILCGGLTSAGEIFMDRVKESVKRRQMQLAGRNVRICKGSLGEYGPALGATRQLVESFFEAGGIIPWERV